MANEREEGLAALQNGDFATAQTKLEAAISQNPQDAQAHLYLGGVYHQQQRDMDAVRVLTRATELLPMSSQAQYNLGIALEALGSQAQALETYRRATALQDNYPLAQQGIERMQKALQAAPPTGMYGAAPAPTGYEATTNTATYASPAAPAYQSAPTAQPYMQDQTQPVAPYAAQPNYAPPAQPGYAPPVPPVQSGYAQPNVPPGYAQPTAYGEPQQYDLAGNPIAPAQPAYGQAAPGMAAPPPGPAGYQGQQWSPYPAQGQMAIEDNFSLVEAYKGWFQLLFTPRAFFAARQGASGLMAPLAMFTAYMLAYAGVYMIIASLTLGIAGGIGAIIGAAIGAVISLICVFIIGGIIHGVSRLFGGNGEYSGTVGAYIYSMAPTYAVLVTIMVIGMGFMGTIRAAMMGGNRMGSAAPQGVLLHAQYTEPSTSRSPFGNPGNRAYTPGGMQSGYGSPYNSPYSSRSSRANPFAAMGLGILMVMGLIGLGMCVWMAVLLGMGLCATQNLSTGGAIGTVIVSFIVMIGIGFVLSFALASMFVGMASSMAH